MPQGNEGIPAWDQRLEKLQHNFSAAYKRASPDFQVWPYAHAILRTKLLVPIVLLGNVSISCSLLINACP